MSLDTARPGSGPRTGPGWLLTGSRMADLALVSAVLMAASVSRHAVYTGYGVTILLCCVVTLAAAVWRGAAAATPSRAGTLVALAGALVAQLIKPPYMNVEGATWLLRAGVWAGLASTALIATLLLPPIAARGGRRLPVVAAALVATGAAYLLVVRGSTRPLIDVWAILQGASLGAAHGQNPYGMVFSDVPGGQVNDCFNYLPATFLVPMPGRLLFGDVRYAEAAVLWLGVAALAWVVLRASRSVDGGRPGNGGRPGAAEQPAGGGARVPAAERPAGPPVALALGLLAAVLPGALYDVQQGWNETILAGALIAAAVLVSAGRPWWAMACLAVALATKQHVLLLLPLWACWPSFGMRRAAAAAAGAAVIGLPWLLADVHRFWHCAVEFFLDLPARADSLSVWQLVPGPLRTSTVLALAGLGYAIVLRRAPRTPGALLVGSGLVLAMFDLANKQSFLNQWLLVAQLVVAGLALAAASPQATTRTPTPPHPTLGPAATPRSPRLT